jgi:hypothetical protein
MTEFRLKLRMPHQRHKVVMRRIVAVAVLLVLCACAAPLSPSATTTLAPAVPLASGEIALPIEAPVSLAPGVATACAGVGVSAVLHGSAADPRVAWLVNDLGTRVDVVWPPGYRARFNPNLEVLDASGVVLLRLADVITGVCGTADPYIWLLEPPFT